MSVTLSHQYYLLECRRWSNYEFWWLHCCQYVCWAIAAFPVAIWAQDIACCHPVLRKPQAPRQPTWPRPCWRLGSACPKRGGTFWFQLYSRWFILFIASFWWSVRDFPSWHIPHSRRSLRSSMLMAPAQFPVRSWGRLNGWTGSQCWTLGIRLLMRSWGSHSLLLEIYNNFSWIPKTHLARVVFHLQP